MWKTKTYISHDNIIFGKLCDIYIRYPFDYLFNIGSLY